MICSITGEAHSLSYVTNREMAKQPGETLRCKGYFYKASKSKGKYKNYGDSRLSERL